MAQARERSDDEREAEAVAFLLALARTDPVGFVRMLGSRLSPQELRDLGQTLVGLARICEDPPRPSAG